VRHRVCIAVTAVVVVMGAHCCKASLKSALLVMVMTSSLTVTLTMMVVMVGTIFVAMQVMSGIECRISFYSPMHSSHTHTIIPAT